MEFERAGDCWRQAMQGVESRPGALQAPCHALPGAPQVVPQRGAEHAWVEDNLVFGHIRERPHGSHTLYVLCEPVCRVPRHAEGARAFLASVKLCEYRPSLRHVQGIVAQYVALAGVVADRGDGVPTGPGLIWCHISRRVSDREQLVHVSRI